MPISFQAEQSLSDFQRVIGQIYAIPDDRQYSLWDLLTQKQRFTMRALKGIRKGDQKKLKMNSLIAFSWLMAIANRLHINLDEEVWHRFPAHCSYCLQAPCACRSLKIKRRKEPIKIESKLRPKSLNEIQTMFEQIYPSNKRTLDEAGVHLAEETGEVSEAIHNYLGKHQKKLFDDIKLEMADYVSCFFGVANSSGVNVSQELAKMYSHGCHVCHQAPCICSFESVVKLKS